MALKDFVGLVKSLSPAMATLLLRGMPETLDSYGRTRTIVSGTGGPVWRRNKKGFFLGNNAPNPTASGGVTVADAAESRAVSATLLWMTLPFQIPAGESPHRILAKYDGAALGFQVYANGANQLVIGADATLRTVTSTALTGSKSAAIRWTTGGTPQLFVDGLYRADATGTIAPTADDSPIYLANNFAGNAGSSRNSYGFFAIFNDAVLGRAITDEEIRELHDAWMSIDSVFEPKRKIYLPRKATDIVATAPLLHWAGERNAQGLLLDLLGNGRNGTISGRVTQTKTPEGTCQVGHGAGDPLIVSASDAALNPSSITVETKFKRNGRGPLNSGVLFSLVDNATSRFSVYEYTTILYGIAETYSDGIAYWTFAVPNIAQKPIIHLVVRFNRSVPGTPPTVYVDGEAVTVNVFTAKSGTLLANTTPRFMVLNRGGSDLDFDGRHYYTRVYSSLLTDAECRKLYLDHALSGAQRLANRTDYPVSVANVTAAGRAGPWRWLNGTLSWSDDGTRRRILSGLVNSKADAPASSAFGAWYWRQKATATSDSIYMPIASRPGIYNLLGQTGYAVDLGYIAPNLSFYLFKIINGSAAAVITSSALGALTPGVEYEFFLTRRARDGLFSIWVRGGAYTSWTSLATPAADTTYTTCVSQNVSLCNTEYVADVRFFPNGGTLLPTEVPDLAA